MKSPQNRFYFFVLLLLITGGGIFYVVKNLEFEEKITNVLPSDPKHKLMLDLIDNAAIFDRIIVHIFTEDSISPKPKLLVEMAEQLTDSITKYFIPEFIQSVEGKSRPDMQQVLFQNFKDFLPFYMGEPDYRYIDSLIGSENLNPLVAEHMKVINSPAGFMAARILFSDPLGIISKQYERLKALQVDDNLLLYRNYLVSKDKQHLTFFLLPAESDNNRKNAEFIEKFEKLISQLQGTNKNYIKVEYTGAVPIAVANAKRIQRDIQLTVNIALLVIVFLIVYFYRRWHYFGLILLPAFMGATLALLFFTLQYGKISAISLGIGSVLLGISVDYAFHIFTHLKHTKGIQSLRKDVSLPILMSSLTTGSAFLGLLALSSPALRQLGIFAAISVVGAALISIFVLPHLSGTSDSKRVTTNTYIEKLAAFTTPKPKYNFLAVTVITLFFALFAGKVAFEPNFEKLNYMTPQLTMAEKNLERAGDFSGKKSYLLSEGVNLNEAILNAKNGVSRLDSLKNANVIHQYNSALSLLVSTEEQEKQLAQWRSFWSAEKIAEFKALLAVASQEVHLKPEAYNSFFELLDFPYGIVNPEVMLDRYSDIASSFKITSKEKVYLAHIIHLDEKQRKTVSEYFQSMPNNHLVDKKIFFSGIFETLQTDFKDLLLLSTGLVFIIVLVFLGRIELAIVTTLPVFVSWIWTLGFMGLFDLKLNFFNIVICSLIFGLGIDYAIFITRGLMQEHKTGQKNLVSYKSSILISAITTTIGLGVLLFAKHPALKSIAGLAIIGIVSSVIISFALQPVLFRFLVGKPEKKRRNPVTLVTLLGTIVTFGLWGISSLLTTALLPFIIVLPVAKHRKQYLVRYLTSKISWFILFIHPLSRYKKMGFDQVDLQQPSIIVSNHQSMVDILFFLTLSPNIIILTKDWVWNNIFFGAVVRYAGHLNISAGYDQLQEAIEERIQNNCSLLVFPEGSRSNNGEIKRYHKGGFYLAEQNSLPLHKAIIHGLYEFMPKGSVTLGASTYIMKYVSTHTFSNPEKNEYSKIGKAACAESRKAFELLKQEDHVYKNYNFLVRQNYIYKGPVLEHYIRVKLALEDNYRIFNSLVPRKGKIYDIGCGYGPMTLMLKLLSKERELIGLDYDVEKIETARNTQLNFELNIDFRAGDAMELKMGKANAVILSDILHYLERNEQTVLLNNTAAALNPNGKIIIRDGDSSQQKRHKGTKLSEFFSTRLGFNKTRNPLNFFSKTMIEAFAADQNMNLEIIDNTRKTSNLIYVLEKKN
jgi:1-acyl-sn-glycerol-3-phosphate acyltransferase